MNPSATMQPGIVPIFEKLLGPSSVICDEPARENYAIDGIAPQVVLLPDSSEQIAAVLRIAGAENWTVIPFGGGTRQYVGRGLEAVDIILSTERLNRIQIYDPGDLTVSLDAGVKLDHIAHACSQHRQLLPIEAAQDSTIGGALATNTGGPMRTGFGSLRDFCIGINFITGDGASARGGGRVVKNVAGYDLMKLMIGSYGTLGVIVSANFKLFPLPLQTMTCICEFGSSAQLFQFRDHLLKSPLSLLAAEVVSPAAVEYLMDIEPRNPDSWAPEIPAHASERSWQLALRFSGSDRVLARCRKDLGDSVASELKEGEENNFWAKLRAFESRVFKRHHNAMIFHVDVPIAESQSMVEAAQQAAIDYNFMAAMIGRATLGSFVIAFLTLAVDPPAVTQFSGAASDFRSRLSRAASAIVTRCPREAKQHLDVWGTTPTDVELMRKIKRALDPRGILNRGRFLIG